MPKVTCGAYTNEKDSKQKTCTCVEGTVTTLTNSYTPEKVSATIKKVWDDAENQDGKRPESLNVTLSNGTEVTLNESNNWTAMVEDLPKYDDGQVIEYTWTEGTLPEGYVLKGDKGYRQVTETRTIITEVRKDGDYSKISIPGGTGKITQVVDINVVASKPFDVIAASDFVCDVNDDYAAHKSGDLSVATYTIKPKQN